ncbi:hypothetical protein ACFLS4_03765 [Bacteroidota bacterium]
MKNKLIKSKLGYTLYLICKIIILIGATFLLIKTVNKYKYDYQQSVSFTQWLGSISLFFFAIEEIIIDLLILFGKRNISRHTPALFYMESSNIGFKNKGLSELSSIGIIWRLLALLIVMCLCISIILYGFNAAAIRYSYGDYDSAIFLLLVIIGGLLILVGVLIQFYKLYKCRIKKN